MKDYNKKPSFNYEKTCFSVAMLKSIRILLFIVAYFDYEIWKMDVKIAFLNNNIMIESI